MEYDRWLWCAYELGLDPFDIIGRWSRFQMLIVYYWLKMHMDRPGKSEAYTMQLTAETRRNAYMVGQVVCAAFGKDVGDLPEVNVMDFQLNFSGQQKTEDVAADEARMAQSKKNVISPSARTVTTMEELEAMRGNPLVEAALKIHGRSS